MHMKKTTMRQANLRLRKELINWLLYYIKQLKKSDPSTEIGKQTIIHSVNELEKIIREYISLDLNKGELNVRKK